MGKYVEAKNTFIQILRTDSENFLARVLLIATLDASGESEKARDAAAELLGFNPNFSVSYFVISWRSRNLIYQDQSSLLHIADSLRKAGLD